MTVVISDLVARVRAEGVEQTTQQVKAVGEAATQTARALQIMAEAATKQSGGTPQGWMEIFQRGNVAPTAAAMAQAATEMQRLSTAAQAAAQPAQTIARAATEHAAAAATGARAAQSVAEGWKMSESNIVRFGSALVGVNLGISLIAGAATLVHDAISNTVQAQLDWERSLVQVRALYGDIAPRVVALSQAQAAMPGVTASQQQLLQANIAAGFLTTRFGASTSLTGTLTTQAARLGGLLYPRDQGQQAALQAAFVAYARSGGGSGELEAATGQAYDPFTLASRLGFTSEAALQGLTPQQLVAARGQLVVANAATANIQGGAEQRGLLDTQRELQHTLEQAQAQMQTGLENLQANPPAIAGQTDLARATNFPLLGPAGERQQAQDIQRFADAQAQYEQAVKDAQAAVDANSAELANNQRQLADATAALARMGLEANSAAARLLSFTGSLENVYSIARGDVGAQAQAAVAGRARSAIPAIGTPQAEINFQANQTAYQQAYQNYVARQAQGTQDNAIRQFLQDIASSPATNASQRQSARQALDEAQRAGPVQARIGEAQRSLAVVDLQTAQTQASLERIQLTQRERYVQLLRDTVDLRRLDVTQQMGSIDAANQVIRVQQAALPAQATLAAAQYQTTRASVLARARMARVLQGKDVSNLPSIEDLIQMNVQGQFAEAEAGPAALEGNRAIEVAQQTATSRGLNQQLTQNNIQLGQLGVDLQNLGDLPTQTALELELVQNNREQLGVQKELRDATLALVQIMGSRVDTGGSIDLGSLVFGEGGDVPAPQTLPGARRGPF